MSAPGLMDYDSQIKIAQEALLDAHEAGEIGLVKEAADAITKYTRKQMREDGIFRQVLPMVPVQNSDLDRTASTELPIIVCELEPTSPAAMTVPLATLPMRWWLRGKRYEVTFTRLITPQVTKDVDQLRTWIADLRQIVSDNMLRDLLTEEDTNWFRAVNTAIIGPDVIVPTSGVTQWRKLSSGITRDGISEMMDILPSTPSSLEVQTLVINNLTVNQLTKLPHNEMGGTVAQDIFLKGWTQRELMGRKLVVTIKKALVPTRTFYLFSDPDFTGKSFSLEDAVMYVERKMFFVTFAAYEFIGAAIANTNAVGRADFDS